MFSGALSCLFVLVATNRLPLTNQARIEQLKKITVDENSAIIDLVKKASPSVVSIISSNKQANALGQVSQSEIGAGTGMVVGEDGLILTNKHVVDSADSFKVITSEGKEYSAKLLATDPTNDIAFIKADAHDLKPIELGDSGNIQVGQRVAAIGNALGQFQNTVTTGIISGIKRPIVASGTSTNESLSNLFQTDAAINPGNSGGPLLNIDGQVIGINTAVAGEGSQNIGFAIPINEAKNDIYSVQTLGRIAKPYLGVRYVAVSKQIATRNNLPVDYGAYVIGSDNSSAVIPGSPADKAGLKEGDIILKINDQKIDSNNSLSSVISNYKIGDKIKLIYLRDGKESTAQVVLGENSTKPN
jgi:serine protease Do